MENVSINTPSRGRGAQSNPDGRFSKLRYEADGDALDVALVEAEGELPGPLTQFLPDATQSILAHNDSPDIGFDTSLIRRLSVRCRAGLPECHALGLKCLHAGLLELGPSFHSLAFKRLFAGFRGAFA